MPFYLTDQVRKYPPMLIYLKPKKLIKSSVRHTRFNEVPSKIYAGAKLLFKCFSNHHQFPHQQRFTEPSSVTHIGLGKNGGECNEGQTSLIA